MFYQDFKQTADQKLESSHSASTHLHLTYLIEKKDPQRRYPGGYQTLLT